MLMCLTAPEVAQYEDGVQTLQNEIAARKTSAKEKEDEISSHGLPIFQQIAVCLYSPSFRKPSTAVPNIRRILCLPQSTSERPSVFDLQEFGVLRLKNFQCILCLHSSPASKPVHRPLSGCTVKRGNCGTQSRQTGKVPFTLKFT